MYLKSQQERGKCGEWHDFNFIVAYSIQEMNHKVPDEVEIMHSLNDSSP